MEPTRFEFGRFSLDRGGRVVTDNDGVPIEITAKAFDTLLYFVEHPGVVLERATLLDALWPGTVVEENSLSKTVAALRRVLGDGYIATVRGRGYQFVANVRVRGGDEPVGEPLPTVPLATQRSPALRTWVPAAVAVGAALVAVLMVLRDGFFDASSVGDDYSVDRSEGGSPPSPRSTLGDSGATLPRVAVLPCDNLSPDANDAYLALSLHQEILDQLGKLRGLRVTSRSSVMQYAGSTPLLSQVADELHVDAVVDCTVRHAGGRLVVTASLHDPSADVQLWSQTFPGDIDDVGTLIAMQSEIARRVAESLDVGPVPSDRERVVRLPTRSNEAYSHYLRALDQRVKARGSRSEKFLAQIELALAVDPDFAAAYVERGFTHLFRAVRALDAIRPDADTAALRASANRETDLARRSGEQALELDEMLGKAHALLGAVAALSNDHDQARERFERAVQLSPSDPETLSLTAGFHLQGGRQDEARSLLEQARRIDPRSTETAYYFYLSGDCDSAIDAMRPLVELNPAESILRIQLGFCASVVGRRELAETSLRIGETLLVDRLADTPARLLPGRFSLLIYSYGRIGLDSDAWRLFERFESEYYDAATHWVRMDAYLGIGDVDSAFREASAGAFSPIPPFVGESHKLEFIANAYRDPRIDEPRFAELRRRMAAGEPPRP